MASPEQPPGPDGDLPPAVGSRPGLRLTRSVFSDLAIWMVGLGAVTGLVFPFFVTALGVDPRQVLTPWFFGATLAAGLFVGVANVALARRVVGARLEALSERMRRVADASHEATRTGDWAECADGGCLLDVDSDDALGESAQAFNQLISSLERFHRIEGATRDLLQRLARHLDPEALASDALAWAAEHLDAGAGAVLLVDDGLVALAGSGDLDADALAAACEPHDLLEPPSARARAAAGRGLRSVPIEIAGRHLAVVVLADDAAVRPADGRLIDSFRSAFAVALDNALAHADTQRQADLDGLTGCANRRHGLRRLDAALRRGHDQPAEVGLLMLDLDHFKGINDAHGHLVGDDVLVHAARVMRSALRAGDTLVRYGGEEFLILLPGAGRADVVAVGERIRTALAAAPVLSRGVCVEVTASLGAAHTAATGGAGAPEALIEHADRALLAAKAAGRNRLVEAA